MRVIESAVVKSLIEAKAEDINSVYRKVDQDDYNSHLMWPVLFYTAVELGEGFRDIEWVLGEHSLLGRYTDQVGEFDAWLIPLTTHISEMAKELLSVADEIKLWNIFSLENVALAAALQRGGWEIKLGERNIYLNNELLVSFKNMNRKRSGVRRYDRGLVEGKYKIVPPEDFDATKYDALISRWYARQLHACNGDADSDIMEYCKDAKAEAYRFLSPPYLQAFQRVADLAKIKISHIILQDQSTSEYVAAGFGTQVGSQVWAMPVRIVDTGCQYLSDWLWQWMARQFSDMTWCADGHDGSHLGDEGLATFKQRYLRRCDGFMQQALFLVPP